MVDIMVRAEDASKINRIVERFKLATVDTVSIKRDIEQSKADKTASSAPEQEKPDKAADDRLLDDLLGAPVQKGGTRIPKPCGGKDGEIPSVRAYLREAKQNRRGYC